MREILESTLQDIRDGGTQQDSSLLAPVNFISYNGDDKEIVFSAPSLFYRDQFIKRFAKRVQLQLEKQGYGHFHITCRITGSTQNEQLPLIEKSNGHQTAAPAPVPLSKSKSPAGPKSCFSFDRFITGPSNQFTYSYAKAVSENPGKTYNPLFIYGGSGLGKTHLLTAIALHLRAHHPQLRVVYQTAEQFTNRMIAHIQRKRDAVFREVYRRRCDVLLIDDIQFIAGKERTTEEFFHIFNSLYMREKQIVLTSDMFPKDISAIPDRLRSRFSVGLIADIQPPELETRIAILKEKARFENVHLPDEVLYYVASICCDHVRQIEGALMQLKAYGSIIKDPITLKMAKVLLHGTKSNCEKAVTIDGIFKAVSRHYNVSVSDMRGPRRQKEIVIPRQVAMYMSRKLTKMSFPEIGRKFGNRDHTTVMHADKKVDQMIKTDENLSRIISSLSDSAREKS